MHRRQTQRKQRELTEVKWGQSPDMTSTLVGLHKDSSGYRAQPLPLCQGQKKSPFLNSERITGMAISKRTRHKCPGLKKKVENKSVVRIIHIKSGHLQTQLQSLGDRGQTWEWGYILVHFYLSCFWMKRCWSYICQSLLVPLSFLQYLIL